MPGAGAGANWVSVSGAKLGANAGANWVPDSGANWVLGAGAGANWVPVSGANWVPGARFWCKVSLSQQNALGAHIIIVQKSPQSGVFGVIGVYI